MARMPVLPAGQRSAPNHEVADVGRNRIGRRVDLPMPEDVDF
jgi:hypothetical protein